MQLYMTLFVAALFFVLTPGVLVKLPPGGNKYTVAAVHALVFAVVYCLVHKTVLNFLYPEGFVTMDMKDMRKKIDVMQREPEIPGPPPMSPIPPM
jgi:hypothetical protein